jgi:hypothetical protein
MGNEKLKQLRKKAGCAQCDQFLVVPSDRHSSVKTYCARYGDRRSGLSWREIVAACKGKRNEQED